MWNPDPLRWTRALQVDNRQRITTVTRSALFEIGKLCRPGQDRKQKSQPVHIAALRLEPATA
jgi:hypothetical protein